MSVVVVSRGRPQALKRCLIGLEQLFYRPFEVVVVADPAGISAVASWQDDIKSAMFDEANISAARNIGAGLAAGEILAFIDDDSVPEPSWLSHLIAPFADPRVAIAGGYVLGRDGVNFQYRAAQIDPLGNAIPMVLPGDLPKVFASPAKGAIKTEGTNFAIRRQVLAEQGGFDEAFGYFMDESDLNMRLARAGERTAIVPLAQVHHGFAASDRRSADRRALDLFDIGASLQVFLRKHSPGVATAETITAMRGKQQGFQEKFQNRGGCDAAEVRRVLKSFDDGVQVGLVRPFGKPVDLGDPTGFRCLKRGDRFSESVWLSGHSWQRRRLQAEARARLAAGHRVTLILLGPTARAMRAGFTPEGIWLHRGGQFGATYAGDPRFRFGAFRRRIRDEIDRTRPLRGFTD